MMADIKKQTIKNRFKKQYYQYFLLFFYFWIQYNTIIHIIFLDELWNLIGNWMKNGVDIFIILLGTRKKIILSLFFIIKISSRF